MLQTQYPTSEFHHPETIPASRVDCYESLSCTSSSMEESYESVSEIFEDPFLILGQFLDIIERSDFSQLRQFLNQQKVEANVDLRNLSESDTEVDSPKLLNFFYDLGIRLSATRKSYAIENNRVSEERQDLASNEEFKVGCERPERQTETEIDLRRQMTEMAQELTALQQDKVKLESDHREDINRLIRKNSELCEEKKQLEGQITILNSDSQSKLDAEVQRNSELNRKKDELEDQVTQLLRDKDFLEKGTRILQTNFRKMEGTVKMKEQQISELKIELQNAISVKEFHQKLHCEMDQSQEATFDEVQRVVQEVEQNEQTIAEYRDKISRLTQKMENQELVIERQAHAIELMKENELNALKAAATQSKLDEAIEAIEMLQHTNKRLEDTQHEMKLKNEILKEEVEITKEMCNEREATIIFLETAVKSLSETVAFFRDQINAPCTEAVIEPIAVQCDCSDEESNRKLRNTITELEKIQEAHNSTIHQHKATISALETTNEHLARADENRMKQVEELMAVVETLRNTIDTQVTTLNHNKDTIIILKAVVEQQAQMISVGMTNATQQQIANKQVLEEKNSELSKLVDQLRLAASYYQETESALMSVISELKENIQTKDSFIENQAAEILFLMDAAKENEATRLILEKQLETRDKTAEEANQTNLRLMEAKSLLVGRLTKMKQQEDELIKQNKDLTFRMSQVKSLMM